MSQNGKGSRNRVSNRKQFRDNYDEIFRGKTPYQKYLENFYNYNAINHGELPLTEYEFNNPKDYEG